MISTCVDEFHSHIHEKWSKGRMQDSFRNIHLKFFISWKWTRHLTNNHFAQWGVSLCSRLEQSCWRISTCDLCCIDDSLQFYLQLPGIFGLSSDLGPPFVTKEKCSRTKDHIQSGHKGQLELQKIWHKWFPQRNSYIIHYKHRISYVDVWTKRHTKSCKVLYDII